MRLIRIADIGDGLSGGIYTHLHKWIQIDCGSQQSSQEAYEKGMAYNNPSYFMLSHFHTDHYNGLFTGIQQNDKYDIEEVIMPILPQFKERTEYLKCLFAVNIRMLGGSSGSMDYDFLTLMGKLSNQVTKYKRVKKGDEIVLGGEHFQILWPPETLNQEDILSSVKQAIEKFNNAKEEDKVLGEIYDSLNDSGVIKSYLNNENFEIDSNLDQLEVIVKREDIPDSTKEANKGLRKIANRISLGFRSDSKLLFLGDMEANEINQVISELRKEERLHFNVLMTPHHGTHWGKEMQNLSIETAISSVGKKLFWHTKPNYKEIANLHMITHLQGDIVFPQRPYWMYYDQWWF